MAKLKTIKLEYGYCGPSESPTHEIYKVIVISESVEFVPGQLLSKSQVKELCESKHWKVTITPSQPGISPQAGGGQ